MNDRMRIVRDSLQKCIYPLTPMQSFSDATMINQASRPHLFHATTKNTHTLAAGAFVLYMVAYYATTPMTTFDVLFVCGTLILRIAGAFLIACLTSHTDRRCYSVCFSALHVDGRRSFNLHVGAFVLGLFCVACTRTRLSVPLNLQPF